MTDNPSGAWEPFLASEEDAGRGSAGRAGPETVDWFEASWNPTAGCTPRSPGCDNCYAMRIAARLAQMGGKTGARYNGLTVMERSGPRWTGELRVDEDLLGWPLTQRRPRRIAVNGMSDLFHEGLETAVVDLLHAVMAIAPWHRFLVLTKRSARMQAYYSDPQTPGRIVEKFDLLSSVLRPLAGRSRASQRLVEGVVRPAGLSRWPLPNLWLGVSVEDQARMTRVRDLLDTPAVIRWVCYEPLLEPVRPEVVPVGDAYFDAFAGRHFTIDGRGRTFSVEGPAWQRLDWVVVGGEIGAGARPMQLHWVRAVRDKCIAGGIPFFFRQWGEWAPARLETPQQMTRLGKRTAGRLLDGRTWDELPAM